MTKTFTFTNNTNKNFFHSEPDYSKMLDNIILDSVIKKNSYLFDDQPIIKTGGLKKKSDFQTACDFLANYKTKNIDSYPYIIGKMYTLFDGTPIVFYDDEVQIGFDTYSYSDFANIKFLTGLPETTKKAIINIYINGNANVNIKIAA